jgi:magnesium-transporting ATPase (P-type)
MVLGKGASTSMSTAADPKAASEVAPWHAISVDQVVKRLGTDTGKGLDTAEAASRLQKHGVNRLPEGKKQGPLMRFCPSSTTFWSTSCSELASPS